MSKTMNLKELSRALGLSQTTVSRALNGYPEVSEATRKRVADAADVYGYAPSRRAKGLATGRAYAVGHVISVAKDYDMVNPIFGDFIAGAGETYAANGYEMVLSIVGPDRREADVFEDLKRRRAVDGVIIQAPQMKEDRIGLLRGLGMPFVVHGRASLETAPYSWLDVNNTRAFSQAVRYLAGLGHRRIGLINGDETMDFAYRRRVGFEAGMREAGLEVNADHLAAGEMSEDYGYRIARDFLRRTDRPTALLVSSILSAIGVRRAIGESPLQIGKDISVMIFDDMLSYLQNSGDRPYFTAMQSSVRQAGRELAQMLLAQIDDPLMTPQQTLLDATLIEGQSTGPAPA